MKYLPNDRYANVKEWQSVEEEIQKKCQKEEEEEFELRQSEGVVLDAKAKRFFSSSSYLELLATQSQ
jgi:hypothetical protein